MPRIPHQVMDCPFYLYRTREEAEKGVGFGGTGFFVGYPGTAAGYTSAYAITNWHVAVRDGFSVIRVNKIGGGTDIFEFDASEWEFQPNGPDIAIIGPSQLKIDNRLHQIIALGMPMLMERPDIQSLGIMPGEDIFMIGRFIDHDGHQQNIPAARFGNISVMPQRVAQPTGGSHDSFILDIHSRTGYSGSPVFVYRTFGSDLTLNSLNSIAASPSPQFIKLLGVHWGQFPEKWELREGPKGLSAEVAQLQKSANEKYIEGMSGMTLAIPAWEIKDFLEMPKFVEERRKLAARSTAAPGPVAESGLPATDENPTHASHPLVR